MTFSKSRALHVAGILEATGPHQYYPTDAEIQEAAALLKEACEQLQWERDHSKMLSERNSELYVEKRAVEEYCNKVRGEYTAAAAQRDSLQRDLAAAREECERYKAVYEAAKEWRQEIIGERTSYDLRLEAAIDALATASKCTICDTDKQPPCRHTTASKETP